jgi:hypothetical protein
MTERAHRDGRLAHEATFWSTYIIIHTFYGEPDKARAAARPLQQLTAAAGNPNALGWSLLQEGIAGIDRDDGTSAIDLLRLALEIAVNDDLALVANSAQRALAWRLYRSGDIPNASRLYGLALQSMRRRGSWMFTWQILIEIAHILARAGQTQTAATLYAATRASPAAGAARYANSVTRLGQDLARTLGTDNLDKLAEHNEHMPIERAAAIAADALATLSNANDSDTPAR